VPPTIDLAVAGVDLTRHVNDLAIDWLSGRPTPGFRRLGVGAEEIERNLAAAVEPVTRLSVWAMQPILNFEPRDGVLSTNARSRDRGLDLRMITTERTLRLNPLLSSEQPELYVGPAQFQFILVDGVTAVVAGPFTEHGFPTAWLATRSEVVRRVTELWNETWVRSRPAVPAGARPPFTPRQCLVARRLVVGTKDTAIARELGVSLRTVAGEIAQIMRQLGAGNRAEVTLVLKGGADRVAGASTAPYLRSVQAP
jgi:DNA-binding CsgD family transcriptional regulator